MNSDNKNRSKRAIWALLAPLALMTVTADPAQALERDLSGRRLASLPAAAPQTMPGQAGVYGAPTQATPTLATPTQAAPTQAAPTQAALNPELQAQPGQPTASAQGMEQAPAMPQGQPLPVDISGGNPQAAAAPSQAQQDPVYQAWETFLNRRGGQKAEPEAAPAQAPLPPEVQAAVQELKGEHTLLGTEIRQGGVFSTEGLGGLLATVFGGMGLAGAYVMARRAPKLGDWIKARAGKDAERTKVRVMSVNPLSAQGSIAVVEVAGQLLVLGVTSGRVSLLTRLDQNGVPVPSAGAAEEVESMGDVGLFKAPSNGLAANLTASLASTMAAPAMGAPSAAGASMAAPAVGAASTAAGGASRSAVANDFNALLSNLAQQGGEYSSPNPNSPLARYAAMNALRKDVSVEPPPEDMASQVLRKMKTMKRFRGAA
ncbi:MAG: flagellar biosynthetic protein FliO [Myxococcota bacterium]